VKITTRIPCTFSFYVIHTDCYTVLRCINCYIIGRVCITTLARLTCAGAPLKLTTYLQVTEKGKQRKLDSRGSKLIGTGGDKGKLKADDILGSDGAQEDESEILLYR